MSKFLTVLLTALAVSFVSVHGSSDLPDVVEVASASNTSDSDASSSGSASNDAPTQPTITRETVGMPSIVELALREKHKVAQPCIDELNKMVHSAFKQLATPTITTDSFVASSSSSSTTTTTTTSSSSSSSAPVPAETAPKVVYVKVSDDCVADAIKTFEDDFDRLLANGTLTDAQKDVMLTSVKGALSSFIKLAAPLQGHYRHFQTTVTVTYDPKDLHKAAIDALSSEWKFAEMPMIRSDDLFREKFLWIGKDEYEQAVGLASSSKALFDAMIGYVKPLFGDDFAKTLFDKTQHEAFNFDIHIMKHFWQGLNYFRSVFRDVDQENLVLEPARKGLEGVKEAVIDFSELVTNRKAQLEKFDDSDKSDSIGLPYALSTYLELVANNTLKDVETNTIAYQKAFLGKVRQGKINKEVDMIGVLVRDVQDLCEKCQLKHGDKYREPFVAWINGWSWMTACGLPPKGFRYERLLQHSLTDDLHLYSEAHKKNYEELMTLASEKAGKGPQQKALYQAAIKYQQALMAVQQSFLSLGFVKMLPARDLHQEHFKAIKERRISAK